jgi:hypothetical protein
MVRRSLMLAIVALVASWAMPVSAACNAVCRAKCEQTAPPGRVKECIAEWSKINAKGPEYARQKERSRAYDGTGSFEACVRRGVKAGWEAGETARYCNARR